MSLEVANDLVIKFNNGDYVDDIEPYFNDILSFFRYLKKYDLLDEIELGNIPSRDFDEELWEFVVENDLISNSDYNYLPEEFKNYYDGLRSATTVKDPPTKLLGRHYGFVSFQDDDSLKSTHLALNVLVNTDDQSSFVSSAIRYYITPITSIEFAPTVFKGERDTEFGEMPFAHAIYLVLRGRF